MIRKMALTVMGITLAANSYAFQYENQNAEAYYVYAEAGLNNIVDKKVFIEAFKAYKKTEKDKEILTVIDYSKPSSEKRGTVIDIENKKVLFHTYISHGIKSGSLMATRFSNQLESHMTSLGTFRTAETYYGRNGYSLKLDGLDKGINHNARKRYIVFHGARYSEPLSIEIIGMLGRSQGCPSVPRALAKPIIDTIKNGSIIFSYGNGKYKNS